MSDNFFKFFCAAWEYCICNLLISQPKRQFHCQFCLYLFQLLYGLSKVIYHIIHLDILKGKVFSLISLTKMQVKLF